MYVRNTQLPCTPGERRITGETLELLAHTCRDRVPVSRGVIATGLMLPRSAQSRPDNYSRGIDCIFQTALTSRITSAGQTALMTDASLVRKINVLAMCNYPKSI